MIVYPAPLTTLIFDRTMNTVNEKAFAYKQRYLVIFSLDAARGLQNPSFSKGERKMANLEIYNFDHVVNYPLGTLNDNEHNRIKETADKETVWGIAGRWAPHHRPISAP